MQKLLIVVDMQNDFIDGALGTAEAEAIVDNVVAKIDAFDGAVLYTLDTHGDDYMHTMEGAKLPVPHCIKGTQGHALNARVAAACAAKNAVCLEKVTFGARDLPARVKDLCPDGIESIELIGLCTDICVVSNALIIKATFPEANVKVDKSCCAGVTPERHNAALTTMQMCQIDTIG